MTRLSLAHLFPADHRVLVRAVFVLCLALVAQPAVAGPSSPHLLTEVQPDNVTTVQIYLRGDEHHFFYQDVGGYAMVRDADGWLIYYNETDVNNGQQHSEARRRRLVRGGQDQVPAEKTATKQQRRIRAGRHNPADFGIIPGQIPPVVRIKGRRNDHEDDTNSPSMIKRLRRWPRQKRQRRRRKLTTDYRYVPTPPSSASGDVRTTGRFTNLVILLRFAGSKQTKATLPTRQQVATLMNSPTPDADVAPTGSVYSAYREYSYGQVEIFSSITPWIRIGRTERASSNRSTFKRALWQALSVLKRRNLIDGRNYDGITVLHSGYGAEHGGNDCITGATPEERLWAHSGTVQWNGKSIRYGVASALWGNCGQEIARVGMITHELGHSLFRLPDLYDKGRGSGVGSFDVMAYAWGKSNDQYYPPHMSAWTKIKLGWIQPMMIKRAGRYTISSYETNPDVLRIDGGFPSDEYLLVEFRKDIGFDKAFGCSGAVIYHVDDSAPRQSRPGFPRVRGPAAAQFPANGDHYQVAVVQKDRSFHLERGENTGHCEDMWGVTDSDDMLGPGGNVFSTYPNSDSYKNGNIRKTGLRLLDFQKSGRQIEFTITGPYLGRSDRPTTDGGNGRQNGNANNNPGKQRLNDNDNKNRNCRDDKSYSYKTSAGESYPCSAAEDSPHLCRRKDNRKGGHFWNYCKSTCRETFLEGRNPTDICPN